MGQVADLPRSTQVGIGRDRLAGVFRRGRLGGGCACFGRYAGKRAIRTPKITWPKHGAVLGVQQPDQRHQRLAERAKPQAVPAHRKEHAQQQRAQAGEAVADDQRRTAAPSRL